MRAYLRYAALGLAALSVRAGASKAPSGQRCAALRLFPPSIQLAGPRARARVVALAALPSGAILDVSDRAVLQVLGPADARILPDREIAPLRDGQALLKVTYSGRAACIPLTVRGATARLPVDFTTEIEPLLTRQGCNQGACHGAQYGKGGFKLSLFGFDSELDYQHLVKQARGRRVCVADPARSLCLLKPSMSVPHGGGLRLPRHSAAFRLFKQWIEDGAPGPKAPAPSLVRVDVFPLERILDRHAAGQRLVVQATYSNHQAVDVTPWARLDTLNDAVASCSPDGMVKPQGPGQTAIMVRYGGLATVSTIIVPYRKVTFHESGRLPAGGGNPSQVIDALIQRKQQQLGLTPSPLCTDREFIRRVSLDLTGTLPTPEEVSAFLATHGATSARRARLVDSLLERPAFADYWSVKWSDLLRCNRILLGNSPKSMWAFYNWIRSEMRRNVPLDQFARSLILAQGSTYTSGPANYYRVAQNPEDLAETTSQVFMGVRLQCARCHHHPFERWSQQDYYQFAAFFARVGIKGSSEFGIFGNEQIVKLNDSGEVTLPDTGQVMHPEPPGVTLASFSRDAGNPDAGGDRREILAQWLTSPLNPYFARNLANRYWAYMMGSGLVNPIDDERVTNPPSNPPLLDYLTQQMLQDRFDPKKFLRTVVLTQAYQRSSRATHGNRDDTLFYTHCQPRRLPAEVLLDAINMVCGTRESFPGLPQGFRAIQLPDPNVGSQFLDVFGRPQRLIACECERNVQPNLSQTLELMNGDELNSKVSDGSCFIDQALHEGATDRAIIGEMYNRALGRPPTNGERNFILGTLIFADHRAPVLQDVLLTLLNSKEFLFNH